VLRRALVALSLATTLTTVIPWGSSGHRARSSYALVDVAGRAGVLPDDLATAAKAWYLIPVLCGVVLLTAALRSTRPAGVAAATLGTLVAVGGVLVVRSPLVTEPGAAVGIVVGLLTASCGTVAAVTGGRQKDDDRPVGS